MPYLILTRHGESQFNAKSLWTGIWDVPLTDKGRHEARLMAEAIKDHQPDIAFTSTLSRATETLNLILAKNHWHIPVQADAALNERDYGELTGMNKWTVEEQYGQDQFNRWRRSWNEPVPGGETLKDVSERVVPYYQHHISPQLRRNQTVLITAHGNTLRTLIKHLDKLTPAQVPNLEMPFGQVIVYTLDAHGQAIAKDTRRINTIAPPA